jgi:hypothetical protein
VFPAGIPQQFVERNVDGDHPPSSTVYGRLTGALLYPARSKRQILAGLGPWCSWPLLLHWFLVVPGPYGYDSPLYPA